MHHHQQFDVTSARCVLKPTKFMQIVFKYQIWQINELRHKSEKVERKYSQNVC